jgi:hypothetical protein
LPLCVRSMEGLDITVAYSPFFFRACPMSDLRSPSTN